MYKYKGNTHVSLLLTLYLSYSISSSFFFLFFPSFFFSMLFENFEILKLVYVLAPLFIDC